MPTENVPTPITLHERRAQAAAAVADLSGGLGPLTVLGLAGLTNLEVRRVAAIIWGEP